MTKLSVVDERSRPGASLPPATREGPADASERPAAQYALVVDDEALIRWSVAETLTGLGMDVEQAADAAGALDVIAGASAPFDVVILDLRLPDVDDLSLLRRVRQLLPASLVVLMTALGTPEVMAGASEMGVHAVLQKPFELDELSRLLSRSHGRPSS